MLVEVFKTDNKLPPQVQNYIKRFDTNKKLVCPTVFNINGPDAP